MFNYLKWGYSVFFLYSKKKSKENIKENGMYRVTGFCYPSNTIVGGHARQPLNVADMIKVRIHYNDSQMDMVSLSVS